MSLLSHSHPAVGVQLHDLLFCDPSLQNSSQRHGFIMGARLVQRWRWQPVFCLLFVVWKHRVVREDAVRVGVPSWWWCIVVIIWAWAQVRVLCCTGHLPTGEMGIGLTIRATKSHTYILSVKGCIISYIVGYWKSRACSFTNKTDRSEDLRYLCNTEVWTQCSLLISWISIKCTAEHTAELNGEQPTPKQPQSHVALLNSVFGFFTAFWSPCIVQETNNDCFVVLKPAAISCVVRTLHITSKGLEVLNRCSWHFWSGCVKGCDLELFQIYFIFILLVSFGRHLAWTKGNTTCHSKQKTERDNMIHIKCKCSRCITVCRGYMLSHTPSIHYDHLKHVNDPVWKLCKRNYGFIWKMFWKVLVR